ncbi:actin depolymerizing factor [Abortiporus biennis]|nr:actin depolymerizing factor [Abortiporus biennis]
MASGVGVSPECLEAFQDLKLGHKFKYIIYNLKSDNTEIIVQKKGDVSSSYDDFLADLPEDDIRWAVYDFEFEKDGGKRNKLVFVSWAPDNAKIKKKMVAASSRDALRRALVGIAVEIQGTDYSEVAHESVYDKASRGN